MQEERKQGRVCSGLYGIFPLEDYYLQRKYFLLCKKDAALQKKFATLRGTFHSCCFDHRLEMLDLKNTMWPHCHFSRVGLLVNYSTVNPLNSLCTQCTVVLLKTLEASSTKALSRDVASYHETYFHEGQIRQEICRMTAALSLPKIRVLRYTGRVENDLL